MANGEDDRVDKYDGDDEKPGKPPEGKDDDIERGAIGVKGDTDGRDDGVTLGGDEGHKLITLDSLSPKKGDSVGGTLDIVGDVTTGNPLSPFMLVCWCIF
jgi:hypothetical protein